MCSQRNLLEKAQRSLKRIAEEIAEATKSGAILIVLTILTILQKEKLQCMATLVNQISLQYS